MSAAMASRSSDVTMSGYLVHGAIGGMIAGAVMAMVAMVWAAALGMGFWMPLRMIASVPIGVMPTEIGLGAAIPIGVVTHMALSMMFGVMFAIVVAAVSALRSRGPLLVAGTAYGFMLWVVNFFVVSPVIGRPWFVESDIPQQAVSHAVFFGTVLGLYLAMRVTSRPRA